MQVVKFFIKKRYVQKAIKNGEMLPPFYGLAWYEYHRNIAICLPVPFNIVVAILRGCWLWIKHGWHGVANNPRDAYAQGYRDGKRKN